MRTPFNSILFTFSTLTLFFGKGNKMAGAQQCCENAPKLDPSSGTGKVEEFGGLNSYITGPADSKNAVILVTDVFGYEAPNARKVADKIGGAGFLCVMPDFFRGSPYVSGGNYTPWRNNHPPEKGIDDAKPVVEALKGKGVTAIGAVGFCWGAKVVVDLSKDPIIQAGVLIHPNHVTVEDIQGVKAPMSIIGGEMDTTSPPEFIKKLEDALKAKPEVDSMAKIIPGVGHGWAIRYKDDDKVAVEGADAAHQLMLDWFKNHLK